MLAVFISSSRLRVNVHSHVATENELIGLGLEHSADAFKCTVDSLCCMQDIEVLEQGVSV